jgi:PAS domain S-box-containing protein
VLEKELNNASRQIVEGAGDGIIAADREGRITLWNAGAEAIFGYSRDEAVGQSLDLIIPENLRGRHWEGYRGVMKSGVTKYGHDLLAVPALRKGKRLAELEGQSSN